MRYQLAPGKEVWWSSDALPIAIEGNEDVLGKMTGLLRDGTMAWQTLLPQRFGEATVSVRLEEVSGDLLIGRQINVNVRNEFQQRLRRIITLSAQVLGAAVIGLASVLELLEIFNV
jgi:DNA helicase HerA-like ATPase